MLGPRLASTQQPGAEMLGQKRSRKMRSLHSRQVVKDKPVAPVTALCTSEGQVGAFHPVVSRHRTQCVRERLTSESPAAGRGDCLNEQDVLPPQHVLEDRGGTAVSAVALGRLSAGTEPTGAVTLRSDACAGHRSSGDQELHGASEPRCRTGSA